MSTSFLEAAAKEENTSNTALARLKVLVDNYKLSTEHIERIEKRLEEEKEVLKRIATEDIPELMRNAGISEIKLPSGEKVLIKNTKYVKVTDQFEFSKFLKARGDSSIAKMKIQFGVITDEQKAEVLGLLRNFDHDVNESIHHQTLQKYFRELLGSNLKDEDRLKRLEAGDVIPEEKVTDFVSIYETETTLIK